MADRFLLQSGSGIIELQSSTDDLILQSNGGASAALDDGGDSFWGGFQSAIVTGAVIAAMALSVGNARAAASPHQDEYPYATGNGIRYSQPYTQRAQVKPVFVSWAQGDEFPQQAAPTVGLDDSGFFPSVKPPEPVIWLPQSEDFTPTKLVEEEASLPFSVNGEIGFKVEWPNDTLARIQVEESYWESPFTIPQIPGVPRWEHQDEIPQQAAPAQGSGGLTYRSVKVFSWHQEDPLPEQTVIFPAEEAEAFLQPPIKEPPQEVSFHTDEIPTRVEEEGWEFSAPAQLPAVSWVWNQQDEAVTAPPAFSPLDEDWVVPYSLPSDASGIIWVTDDDISPEFAIEEPGWKAEWLIPKPFTEVYQTQDDRLIPVDVSQGGGGSVYDEISIFRFYQEDDLPIPFVPLQIEEDKWLPHESTSRQPSAEGFIWVEDDEHLPLPIENERWPLVQPAYLGKPFVDVFSRQDEVFSAVRDEEPWLLPSYPAGPFTGTFVQNDETVPQPPILIEVEETYWLQPDPPRGVVTSWQFSLEINEDFPELSTPPVVDTPRVHGFEIGPEHGRKGDRTRRGLVTIVEDEAKPERKTITKRDIDHRRFEQARERALEIIADAAQQHAKATKPESQRFASVRMSLKPLAKPLGGWNWISVYQRLYQAALLDAIKNELAIQDGIDEEGAIIAMLMEML